MENSKPVKRGDIIEVKIIDEGENFTGITRFNNFVVIINGALVGNSYLVEIKKVFPKYAIAEIVQRLNRKN
jgi:predicted RNA-binding protein with TRAM domain